MKNNTYYDNILKKVLTETLEEKADNIMNKMKYPKLTTGEFDYVAEGETCECGGEMMEGECTECGMKSGEVMEKLYGNQSRIDKNKNGKIDSQDFKMLRKRRETNEGDDIVDGKQSSMNEKWKGDVEVKKTGEYSNMTIEDINSEIKKLKNKTQKLKDEDKSVPKQDREKMSELYFAKRSKQGWKGEGKAKVNESVLYKLEYINESAVFTEDEIIDIIEGIIKEEDNIKRGKSPAGYSAYEKSHKGSGKEEDDYMKDLSKKMKDYLKDGSKGKYEMNPKIFPKGNGQLEKMEKKAYEISKDGEEFLDDYMRPGMENLDYDEIHPNEDWMKDNIEGSSRTGNNPEWANAEETELGEKINKKRKENKFAKNRRKAYNKAPQPVVSDKPGQESGKGIHINVESVNDKQTQKLTEEFSRMKQLMGYEDNTQ